MNQIIVPQTPSQKLEVVLWMSDQGPRTRAVAEFIQRRGITFGICLIQRNDSDGYENN